MGNGRRFLRPLLFRIAKARGCRKTGGGSLSFEKSGWRYATRSRFGVLFGFVSTQENRPSVFLCLDTQTPFPVKT